MTMNKDMAAIMSFAFEAFFYGCYTVLFCVAIYLKFNGPAHLRALSNPLFIITVSLYLACSTHFYLDLIHFYKVLNIEGVKGFGNMTNTTIGAGLLGSITAFMAELVLLYRCWVLWAKNYWVILFPALVVIGNLVSGIETAYLLLSTSQRDSVTPASVASLNLSSLVIVLCVNTFLIILIAARIWYLSPRKRRDVLGVSSINLPEGTGQTAFAISIECGMICFSTLLVYCVLFATHNTAQVIIKGIEVQIFGIAPTLIYIRLSGLLNTRSLILISSGTRPRTVSTSRPKLTKLGFSHSTTTTTSTDLALAVKVPKSETECKASSGDLGLGFSFVDCDIAV